jgi:hypothetical protein
VSALGHDKADLCVCVCVCDVCGYGVCGSLLGNGKGAKREGYRQN